MEKSTDNLTTDQSGTTGKNDETTGDETDDISMARGDKDNSTNKSAPTGNDQEDIEHKRKAKLYWLNKMEDDRSQHFHDAFVSNHKKVFEHYDITMVNNIKSCSDKTRKVIIICWRVTCHLEQILDYFLEDVDGSLFDRILVIIIHNTDLGEIPQVPSKSKVAKLEPYKELNYIIDVSYKHRSKMFGFSSSYETEILFCEEALEDFLRNYEENIDLYKKKTCVIF